ncbi:MAG: hypothetical protein HUK15_04495, partial [Bacteroidales bacterium]|nr:hypothetical protein [Bacteroidales bacterium]
AEGMVIPADAPKPVVESYFIYEKDGKQEKFTADKVPQGDPSWKFIDAVHEVIEPGYEPPIHDFTIERTFFDDNSAVDVDAIELVYTNEGGEQMFADVYSVPDESWTFDHYVCEDCEDEIDVDKIQIVYTNADGSIQTLGVDSPTTEGMTATEAHYSAGQKDIAPQVLADERYSFLMIALRLDEMDTEHLAEFDSIASFASKNNIGFYCMTSSNEDEIAAFKNEHNPSFEFYNTDPITLKTIVRSNPGLLLIRKGTVIDKWHDGNLPQIKDLQNELTGAMLSDEHNQRNMLVYVLWIVGTFLGMALLKNFYNWLVKNRFINDKNSLR